MGKPQSFQSTDTRALKEDVVQTRALLDVPAAGDVKELIDNFFLNQIYGAFSLNVLADIFVRLFLLICTYLALLCCWKAKKREAGLTELQLQRHLDNYFECQKQYLRSHSYVRRVAQASTSDPQSSSAPVPSVPRSQVQADSLGEQSSMPISQVDNAGISPACPSPANSTITPPTECENVVTGAEQKVGLHEQLPKRRNGFVYDCHVPDELELGRTSSESSSSRCQTVPTQTQTIKTFDDVVIDILPVQGVFPTSASIETGNKFKSIMKDKAGALCEHDILSSRIMQTRVRATDENLSVLRDVAIEGMKLDRGFTLQIGGSFLYYCDGNPKKPVLVSLRDDEVPIVLQADYSAGVLTIRGLYLEGAEIKAATFDGYMILNCIKQDQINNNIPLSGRRLEVWRYTDLLPPVSLDQIQICATKTVLKKGHNITVRSEVSSIQNTTVRTERLAACSTADGSSATLNSGQVIRNWVPAAILIVFLAIQVWILLASLLNLATDPLHRTWLSYPLLAVTIYIIQLMPPSLEDNINGFVDRLKLAVSSFQVLPNVLSSPAFFMRNGYCYKRSADYTFIPGELRRKECSNKKVKIDDVSMSRDWKWPCFKEEFDKSKKKYVIKRFDIDSMAESDHPSNPFTVTYSDQGLPGKKNNPNLPRYIPQNIVIKLYSKYLQSVIGDLQPASLKLFENYGEIQASDLLVLYVSEVLEKKVNLDENSSDPLAPKENRLDMFHLIRFLRKEYEEVITQYGRMMEADVISWDMLWTLIVPKTDVIYYCDISTEELCGNVLSTEYSIPDKAEENKFVVELEAYDYDCVNFEVKRIQCVIFPFKEEVKISDIDVYPLHHKGNSVKAEFFLSRGRRFYDLVVKHEHRFMTYQGLIYRPPPSRYDQAPIAHKESADGRVMIDQGGYYKMRPKMTRGMDSPYSSSRRSGSRGNGLKIKVLINEFDQLLKYAPAIAYGYSFSLRKWGCFTIEGFSEIQFISTAFDALVMNEDVKNTLLTLTEHHIKHPLDYVKGVARNVDPLPNKGKGCIILLHGASGTGKTLTVESLAEKLECPLWQLSVSNNFEELETDLIRTFEIAASWQAILVLDEADVYLSSRKYSPLSSDVTATNAMTGTFLRVLEYYTGILFLTTNMVDSLEPAIYSRMSLSVKYKEFSIEQRKLLWINFFNHMGFQHPSQEFWNMVLPEKFNGRVIRNIIQNAQIIAQSKGALLSEEHLLKACDVMAVPFTPGHFIDSEDKSDPQQASTTCISTAAPSVVTSNSSLFHLRAEEE